VELRVERATPADFDEGTLRGAEEVVGFSVKDTGSGIPPEKLAVIFEAFQQSDGTTSRKYGGTGLGLSISREIAGLLGGRIDVQSEEGVGSRFTLYVPTVYPGSAPAPDTGPAPSPPVTTQDPGAVTSGPTPAALPEGTQPEAAPAGPVPRAAVAETPATWPEPTVPAETTAPAAKPGEPSAPPAPVGPAAEEATPAAPTREGGISARERYTPTRRGPTGGEGHEETWPETTQLKRWLSGETGRVLAGSNVLIVDDDIRNVFALTHVLGRIGISVKYAENGREGLDVLDRSPEVSLVLMDIMMPEMNGYEAIRTIRRTPRLAGLPVIALTAKAMSGDSQKALDSGADLYVAKPVDVDKLVGAMYGLLSKEEGGGNPSAVADENVPHHSASSEESASPDDAGETEPEAAEPEAETETGTDSSDGPDTEPPGRPS
jgi:CheY-like chemotaxis protein